MKILFFFGAGMSRNCGYPTTLELRNSLEIKLKSERRNDPIYRMYDRIIKAFKKDPLDIEELYTYIISDYSKKVFLDKCDIIYERTSVNLFYNPTKEEENLIHSLKIEIENLINETFWDPSKSNHKKYNLLFPKNVVRNEENKICIYSTNYDLSVERFFETSGLIDILNNGLNNNIKFNPKLLLQNYNGIPFFKLHGSIDLYKDENGEIYKTQAPITIGSLNHLNKKILGYFINYPHIGDPDKNYEKFQQMFFDRFEDDIIDADCIIIIGTTFRDELVKETINNGIVGKKVLFIGNPSIPQKNLTNFSKIKEVINHHHTQFDASNKQLKRFLESVYETD